MNFTVNVDYDKLNKWLDNELDKLRQSGKWSNKYKLGLDILFEVSNYASADPVIKSMTRHTKYRADNATQFDHGHYCLLTGLELIQQYCREGIKYAENN